MHRFYRQRLSESKASLAITLRDTRAKACKRYARWDGAALEQMHLSFYRPDGTTKTYPELLSIVAIYPDGVLLRDWSVYFVPVRDGELDMQKKVEVIPVPEWITQRSIFPRAYKPYPWDANFRSVSPLRHTDMLVWLGEAGLEVFDLHDGKRSVTRLQPHKDPYSRVPQQPAPFQPVTAYDGETVVVNADAVYDAKTGEFLWRLGDQRPHDGARFASIVAVRHRIGYCFANGYFMALDLTASLTPPLQFSPTSPRQLMKAGGPFAETDKGLIVRTGEKWITVPWLTKW